MRLARALAVFALSLASTACSDRPVVGADAGEVGSDARLSATDAALIVDAARGTDAAPDIVDAAEPDAAVMTSRVEAITFNWPSRYGPTAGVDVEDRRLWAELSGRASVIALQEAGWIAGFVGNQGWRVHRPNPPGDSDDQPVGNLLAWDPTVWRSLETGAYPLSPRTRIQPEAAGPTYHRPKYVVWARLRNRADGTEWLVGSVHFVPSKHLGGAALALWTLQRDNLLAWWSGAPTRTVVMGDFNAQPGDTVAQPIWQVGRRQTAVSHGDRKIDWIVRKRPLTGPRGEALSNRGQSDHKPVRGVVTWSD